MFTKGFVTGVNYWASNAGIKMWSEFDERVVDSDFEKIARLKMDVVRIFPLWSDFQPVERLYSYQGIEGDLTMSDEQLPLDTELARAYIDETMLERFEKVLNLALKHNLKVTIGIITGWMSGRLFVPPAIRGKNLYTDPVAKKLEMDFVKIIVERFCTHPAVIAWTSGNETDCLAQGSWDERLAFQTMMKNTIRAADEKRLAVMNDMHPLRSEGAATLYQRKGIFDFATVHPYTWFTPYCQNEPIDSARGLMHALSEAKAYEGILGIPCLVEEIGTLGDFLCSRSVSAGYAKANLYSLWINGIRGMFWWCANEQVNLKYPPYTATPLEQELGVFDAEGNEKPIAKEFREFKETIEKLPFEFTAPKVDAVCVLSKQRDNWASVLGAQILSKQAGFNISFAYQTAIPESDVYIMPSVSVAYDGVVLDKFLKRIENGATLIITYSNGLVFSKFEELSGNRILRNYIRSKPLVCEGETLSASVRLDLEAVNSKVLLCEEDSNPLLTEMPYGKGKVIFCAAPLERAYSETVGEVSEGYLNIYKRFAEYMPLSVTKTKKELGITEHKLSDGRRVIAVMNYSNAEVTDSLTFNGVTPTKTYLGSLENGKITLAPFSAAIFEIE